MMILILLLGHPPCNRWCKLAYLVESQTKGKQKACDDNGMFEIV